MTFSSELEGWLESDSPKSLGAMTHVFAEKSFAVTIMMLLLVSATPVPTGGVMLLVQLVAVVVAAQMVIGRQDLWIPKKWGHRELGPRWTTKFIPLLIRLVRRFERHSHPRWASLYDRRWFTRILGLAMLVFAVVSALAPPLTGLDTLPALGAVVIALSIVLEDIVVFAVGMVIGSGGVVLFVAVGAAVIRAVGDWF